MQVLIYNTTHTTGGESPVTHYLNEQEITAGAFANWSKDIDQYNKCQAYRKRFMDAFPSIREYDKAVEQDNGFEKIACLDKYNQASEWIAGLRAEVIEENKEEDARLKAIATKLKNAKAKAYSVYKAEKIDANAALKESLMLVDTAMSGTRERALRVGTEPVRDLLQGKLREMFLDPYFVHGLPEN